MKKTINQMPYLAMRNKEAIENSTQCGCYFCLEIFDKKEISDWTDNNQTALCPHCATDAVVPNIINKEILSAAKKFWF